MTHVEKNTRCTLCNRWFTNEVNLKRHLTMAHPDGRKREKNGRYSKMRPDEPRTAKQSIVTSLGIKPGFLDNIDEHVLEHGYISRSAFFLEAARNQMKIDNKLFELVE